MKNTLKAISQTDDELRVGNYMILFGGRDLTGEFFTKSTDFKSAYTDIGLLYVDFEHGRDAEKAGNSGDNVLGIADWKSAKFDGSGVFVERVLNRRADYVKFLSKLIDAGMIGTSSEAIPGTSRRKSSGEIIEWPLMRDTLTVSPIEPRMMNENVLASVKALAATFPNSKSLALAIGESIDESDTIKDIEEITDFKSACAYLRNAGKFSRSESTALVARMKNLALRNAADETEAQQLIAALSRRTELLRT